ncbi:MAG TPA: hypothetical protein VMR98_02240 [Candidatus Polarisedimenticolaceae bacterium]|nr:hypothetical protein [Candidatus Polarisedimenticolaceae bacterium]
MASKQSPRPRSGHDDNFYETIPGGLYIDAHEVFPVSNPDEADSEPTDDSPSRVGSRMMRQSLILISLLIAQVILFMLLIAYTVNLG